MNLNLMKTYKLCIETCMGIKEGERVLIITNELNKSTAEGLAGISYMKDADPYILSHTSLRIFDVEPPELISDCMKKADVILVALSFFEGANFFHTQARKDAVKRKVQMFLTILLRKKKSMRDGVFFLTEKLLTGGRWIHPVPGRLLTVLLPELKRVDISGQKKITEILYSIVNSK